MRYCFISFSKFFLIECIRIKIFPMPFKETQSDPWRSRGRRKRIYQKKTLSMTRLMWRDLLADAQICKGEGEVGKGGNRKRRERGIFLIHVNTLITQRVVKKNWAISGHWVSAQLWSLRNLYREREREKGGENDATLMYQFHWYIRVPIADMIRIINNMNTAYVLFSRSKKAESSSFAFQCWLPSRTRSHHE